MLRIGVVVAALGGLSTSVWASEQWVVAQSGDLTIAVQPTASVRYHSLDGAPPVPAEGIVVPVECEVAFGKNLRDCSADGSPRRVKDYRAAAVIQASHAKVAAEAPTGKWSDGDKVDIEVHLEPRERIGQLTPVPPPPIPVAPTAPSPSAKTLHKKEKAVPPKDGYLAPAPTPSDAPMPSTTDPAVYWAKQLVFTKSPRGTDLTYVYPLRALDAGVEGVIEMSCVVQADYSMICPNRKVTTNEDNDYAAEFERAAGRIAMLFRVRETMADGKSPVGFGFRQKIRFVMQ